MIIRLGIMSFAHMHAHAYAASANKLHGVQLVGIADHDDERASAAAAQYNTRKYLSYGHLLNAGLDAVVIASENIRHRELTEMAAAAGVHVLCEKPLATTIEDGKAMIDACANAGVKLMTAFPCRFSPVMKNMKRALEENKIGKILAMRATNRGKCPFGWFVDPALSGGGAVIDHTVHATDLMRWITGKEVTEVYAEMSNKMYHQDFEDVGLLTMGFDGGLFATLDASWSRSKSFPTWGDVTLTVVGENGVLSADLCAQNLLHYSDADGGAHWLGWGSNIDELMLGAFCDSIRENVPPPISGEDGMRAASVALAAYESVKAGAPVAPVWY